MEELIQWNMYNTICKNGQTCKGIQNSIAHTKVCLNFLSEKIHTLLSCKCIVPYKKGNADETSVNTSKGCKELGLNGKSFTP